MTRNIVELWREFGPGRLFLTASKDFSRHNHMEPVAAFGALRIDHVASVVACASYATANSPIDCLTGFPAETLHKDGSVWQVKGISNGITLKAESVRTVQENMIIVDTKYYFPDNYNGPQYQRRRICFNAETLRIVKVAMTFKNAKTDTGIFDYNHSAGIKIDWTLESGYLNQMNVNFF